MLMCKRMARNSGFVHKADDEERQKKNLAAGWTANHRTSGQPPAPVAIEFQLLGHQYRICRANSLRNKASNHIVHVRHWRRDCHMSNVRDSLLRSHPATTIALAATFLFPLPKCGFRVIIALVPVAIALTLLAKPAIRISAIQLTTSVIGIRIKQATTSLAHIAPRLFLHNSLPAQHPHKSMEYPGI